MKIATRQNTFNSLITRGKCISSASKPKGEKRDGGGSELTGINFRKSSNFTKSLAREGGGDRKNCKMNCSLWERNRDRLSVSETRIRDEMVWGNENGDEKRHDLRAAGLSRSFYLLYSAGAFMSDFKAR